jgi:hypothetical protein
VKNPQKRREKWCVGPEKVVRKPWAGDPQGNGVSVVVSGRESRSQGEGRQVTSKSKTEEVREMRDAETVLDIIQEEGSDWKAG